MSFFSEYLQVELPLLSKCRISMMNTGIIIYIQHFWPSIIVTDSQYKQVWICVDSEKDH